MTVRDGEAWAPGERLVGRFRLREMIGAGDMGVVWLAHDELLGRTVAVKRIVAGGFGPSAVERARRAVAREGRMATVVAHPRLLRVLDVIGTDDGEPCLVLQHVAGLPWAAMWPRRPAPEAVAHVAAQVAEALAALHAAGVVHGDVTPENVLVTDDGEAKLVDFGAARLLGESPAAPMTGSRDHRAPEIRAGSPAGAPADVYALGAAARAAVGGASAGAMARTLAGLLAEMLADDPAVRPSAADAALRFAAIASAR